MSNDLKRAENLADLFAAPSKPAPVPHSAPATPEPVTRARRSLAVVEDDVPPTPPDTAVAEAVGVMETVITIPADEQSDDLDDAEGEILAEATALADVNHDPTPRTPPGVEDAVARLTTPMRLKGAAERHNIPVPESTMLLLKGLDKQLATTGRPVVSRNALITAAAQRVIADPAAYASAQGRDPQTAFFAIQGRVPTGLPVDLRAAAYSVDPPLVVAHAMAAAVAELLKDLKAQAKRGKPHTRG